jgi:hypothetical protein
MNNLKTFGKRALGVRKETANRITVGARALCFPKKMWQMKNRTRIKRSPSSVKIKSIFMQELKF